MRDEYVKKLLKEELAAAIKRVCILTHLIYAIDNAWIFVLLFVKIPPCLAKILLLLANFSHTAAEKPYKIRSCY